MTLHRIVVERSFDTPHTEADMMLVKGRMQPCLAAYQVTWKRTVVSADRKRIVCEYEAADIETVRRIQHEAPAAAAACRPVWASPSRLRPAARRRAAPVRSSTASGWLR